MTKLHINHLAISWTTSRGRDTYGWNICRLDDRKTGLRFRCNGGGYDMIGTVFGEWLAFEYQDALRQYVEANKAALVDCGYSVAGYKKLPDLYGMTVNPDGRVSLDGGCGINSMERIARALGLEVQWEGNKKGHTIGYYVSREVQEAA